MKLSRPSFANVRRHKRVIGIILSAVLLLAGIAYGLWSYQQWKQYPPAYKAQQATIRTSLDNIYVRMAVTAKEKTAIREDLTGVSQSIDTFGSRTCQINPLVAWQVSVIKSLEKERDQCRAQAARMADVNTQLKRVVAFLEDDQVITEQLNKIPQGDELPDSAWQEQVTTWQSTSLAIEKRTVSQDYRLIQQLVAQRTKAIATAWEAVITAHTAKDKQKYLAAQNDLAESYDGLDEISTETTKMITELAKALENKYQLAF